MAIPNLLARQFKRDGFLLLKNVFTKSQVNTIRLEAEKLYSLPEVKNSYMKYFESSSENKNSKILARIENFIHQPDLKKLKKLVDNEVTPILEEVLESRTVMFKDKMNWKLPGGGSFKPHQDFEAWNDFTPNTFVTCAVFVDECTKENGCLEMVRGAHSNGILDNHYGCINENLVKNMEWQNILCDSYDMVIFDSLVPHKSGDNLTNNSRRVYYFTYNLEEDGNFYDAYFEKKRSEFPPDFERLENENVNLNSKYNLANPIK